jgi:hypothetical protein
MTDVPTASAPKELSEQEFLTWTLARDALVRATAVMGFDVAITTIIQCLWNGVIQARSNQTKVRNNQGLIELDRYISIPNSRWGDFSNDRDINLFDNNNINFVTAVDRSFRSAATIFYYGVRFNTKELLEAIGESDRPIRIDDHTVIAAKTSKGGRPRKDWWDDLWIEICRQIYYAELIPNKQVDIKKAMLDWAAAHQHELSDSAAKTRARKLFDALQNEGKN